MRRLRVAAALLGSTLLFGGCTSSFDAGQSYFSGAQSGPADVSQVGTPVELVAGTEVSPLAEAFSAATGIPVRLVADPQGISDPVIWNAAEAGATPVGRQISCAVANQSWFSVNRVKLPTSVKDLTTKQWAPLLSIDNPGESEAARLWLSGPDREAFLMAATKNGARAGFQGGAQSGGVQSGSAQSGGAQSGASRASADSPIIIASALYPWLTVNNLRTSSEWVALPETCVESPLTVSSSGEAGRRFLDYVLSVEGQAAMVTAGLAYPIDRSVSLPSGVEAVAPAPKAPTLID